MTPEEAIKCIKTLHERNINTGYMQMAIEALEKQIPKKPIRKRNYTHCPTCHNVLFGYRYHAYCEYCGQRLDFSKMEE